MRTTTICLLTCLLVTPSAVAQLGWYAVDNPFTNLNWLDVDFLDEDYGFVVGEHGRIKRTTNGGTDWEFQTSGVSVTLNSVHIVNRDLIFAAGFMGTLIKSTDGGNKWDTLSISGVSHTLLDVIFFSEMEGFVCGSGSLLLKTTDGGASWVQQTSTFEGYNIWQMYAFDSQNIFICGNHGNIARTSNGGDLWISQETPVESDLSSISFADSVTAYCVGQNAVILRTSNRGETWEIHDSGLGLPVFLPFNKIVTPSPSHVYGCGWLGLIAAKRLGRPWELQEPPQDYATIHLSSVTFPSPETGYICGWDGTILKTVNGGTLPVELVEPHASDFTLSALYPNPVSNGREMKARFSIHTRSAVSISVYNMLGNNVAEIARGDYQPGAYAVTIPSSGLPSGMYVLRLTAASGVISQSFVVHR